MATWLLKSDPETYAWADMAKDRRTAWDGVRNYQAANNLKAMRKGERALFYHSGAKPTVVGIVEIVRAYYPDPSDASGRFGMVDVKAVGALAAPVTLAAIKADRRFATMALLRQGRLSVLPVEPLHWQLIVALGGGG